MSERSAGRTWAIRIVVGLVGSGLIVAALFTQIDVGKVGNVLSRARPELLAVAFGIYLVLVALRAWRLAIMMPEARFGPLYAVNTIHLLLLRIMPMRTGELGFAWLMQRAQIASFEKGLVGLFVMRVLDLTTVIVIYAVSLAVTHHDPRTLVIASLVALAGVALAVLMRPALRVGQRAIDKLVPMLRLDRFQRVQKRQRSLADAVEWSSSLSRATLGYVTALTFAQWAVSFSFVLACALAMRLEVDWTQAVQGGVGTIVTTMLPLPGIGTVGTLEAGWAAGFALAGVPRADAIATAFGYAAISFAITLVTGLAASVFFGRRRALPPDTAR
jgi:uncharacterized protein (TIRG00374 family)